ncbi:MAG: VanZ family protein [Pedosphaera sp.]|nr:VanZ family protein [Pedosphaera sp.]
MSRAKNFLSYWLPVIVWVCIIFTASGDSASAQHSSRIIGPIVRWLFPHLDEHAVESIVFYVRKCAHLTEYAIFALLVWRAVRKPFRGDTRPWSWRHAAIAVGAAALFAASDEIHQSYVPHREGKFFDVVIDTCGAALGILALWFLGAWRKRW